MNAFGYIGAMSAGILWSCLHAAHYTRWLRASRINEGFSDLELSFEFYDGFFFFLEGAAYREGHLGSPVLECEADESEGFTLYHVGFPEELIEIS